MRDNGGRDGGLSLRNDTFPLNRDIHFNELKDFKMYLCLNVMNI